jgi:hypothetical protein
MLKVLSFLSMMLFFFGCSLITKNSPDEMGKISQEVLKEKRGLDIEFKPVEEAK